MAHQELGMGLMGKIRKDLENMGTPEAMPKLVGRNIFMSLVPLPAGKRKRHFFGPHDMTLIDEDRDDEDSEGGEEAEKE
jgi:translation initiation factor IF-3